MVKKFILAPLLALRDRNLRYSQIADEDLCLTKCLGQTLVPVFGLERYIQDTSEKLNSISITFIGFFRTYLMKTSISFDGIVSSRNYQMLYFACCM